MRKLILLLSCFAILGVATTADACGVHRTEEYRETFDCETYVTYYVHDTCTGYQGYVTELLIIAPDN